MGDLAPHKVNNGIRQTLIKKTNLYSSNRATFFQRGSTEPVLMNRGIKRGAWLLMRSNSSHDSIA